MAHIKAPDAQRWTGDTGKLVISSIVSGLEEAESSIVLSKLASAFDTSTWVDDLTTPDLIKTIISMRYVSFLINSTYLEDEDLSSYAALLLSEADTLIDGLVTGSITIPDLPDGTDTDLHRPVFYPNDASSILEPTTLDRSLGPAAFSMGQIF